MGIEYITLRVVSVKAIGGRKGRPYRVDEGIRWAVDDWSIQLMPPHSYPLFRLIRGMERSTEGHNDANSVCSNARVWTWIDARNSQRRVSAGEKIPLELPKHLFLCPRMLDISPSVPQCRQRIDRCRVSAKANESESSRIESKYRANRSDLVPPC